MKPRPPLPSSAVPLRRLTGLPAVVGVSVGRAATLAVIRRCDTTSTPGDSDRAPDSELSGNNTVSSHGTRRAWMRHRTACRGRSPYPDDDGRNNAGQATMRSVMKESDLIDIQNLIHRWEEGESVFSDPPLCLDLLAEVRRLRGLLMDVFPMVVGTSMQEPLRLELGLPPVQRRSHNRLHDAVKSLECREVSH